MTDIVLFDLDGTLTPPRDEMPEKIVDSLSDLAEFSEIGIITGSTLEFVREQSENLFSRDEGRIASKFCIYPCNGTQEFVWDDTSGDFIKVRSTNMREHLGESTFRRIMRALVDLQAEATKRIDIPMTGHFISYRDSMINWAPIGRNSTRLDRAEFVEKDERSGFRHYFLDKFRNILTAEGISDRIDVVLGGQTSFDIYPKGWDKSFVVPFLDDYRIWFVGDKCTGNGNDKALFDIVNIQDRGFETRSVDETSEIIETIIRRIAELENVQI